MLVYEFYIDLIAMKDDTRAQVEDLPLPKHFTIKAYCPATFKENKDDSVEKIDTTLKYSFIPSIHIGSLIEFRGTPYKRERNKARNIVIPQQIKTANEIEMDRHYIRIMPPNQESVKRYNVYREAAEKKEKKEQQERDKSEREWERKKWISNRIEDVKKHWVSITLTLLAIVAGYIVAKIFNYTKVWTIYVLFRQTSQGGPQLLSATYIH